MIYLAEKYYLVTGDRFELFYRSIIKKHNPYSQYIKATCEKGYTYNRYFTYTPKEDEVGNYPLTISIFDDDGNVLEEAHSTLIVNKPQELDKKVNILCIGDSLTVNGVWPKIGYEKYNSLYPGKLNFIGKLQTGEVGYEGYGGWQWKTFCENNIRSQTSSVWINCKHNLDITNQHSNWKNITNESETLWVLETIEPDKLKFKRGEKNNKVNPELAGKMICLETGLEINIDSYDYSDGNPFWNIKTNQIDFKNYLNTNNFKLDNNTIDYVFILLTWNGQYKPYNDDFSIHDTYSSMIIDRIHSDFPNAKIGILGIQLPCPNGGITSCYGASGYYHDWYGETVTALNYNKFLEEKCKLDKYKDYCKYFDTKAQFDVEYNYWTKDMKVNNRSEVVERIGINGIHPSLDGYNQIGDSFYRALVEMLKY